MPLGARRLVLIGGLCVPVGLVAGPYLFGLQLVAVAGVIAVAVALSYRRGQAWFSRWSWLAAAAGALWMVATVAYWLSIMAAVDGSSAPSGLPTVLFYLGMAALAVMACGTIAGWISRGLSDRRTVAAAQ
ncbi:putative integral membrane protein (plasmid) [Arthrobacter sp. Rue61a]|nr:putative integral membrane protein [Arthrobacter sp. Rue61a]